MLFLRANTHAKIPTLSAGQDRKHTSGLDEFKMFLHLIKPDQSLRNNPVKPHLPHLVLAQAKILSEKKKHRPNCSYCVIYEMEKTEIRTSSFWSLQQDGPDSL